MVYHIVGAFNDEGPPVPIPNTEVKLISAENTWAAAPREDRSTPTLFLKNLLSLSLFISSFFYVFSSPFFSPFFFFSLWLLSAAFVP